VSYHHGDKRRDQARRNQIIESGCYPRRVYVKTAVAKNQQAVRLFVSRKAVRRVNPNWTLIAQNFAGEFVAPHLSSRNSRTDDAPTLRLGSGQFHCRKESHFIRVEFVPALDVLKRIQRIIPYDSREAVNAAPLIWVGQICCEMIGEACALLKPKCFVPQVSVEQPYHRLTHVPEAKDKNVFRLFAGSPKHSDEHLVIAICSRLNYRRASFVNLIPELIKRGPIT